MLLKYEQQVTLQNQVYGQHRSVFKYLSWLSEIAPSILNSPVPGDTVTFQSVVPGGDLGSFNDRWKWIEKSMLPAWKRLAETSPEKVREMMIELKKHLFKPGG